MPVLIKGVDFFYGHGIREYGKQIQPATVSILDRTNLVCRCSKAGDRSESCRNVHFSDLITLYMDCAVESFDSFWRDLYYEAGPAGV